MKYEPSIQEKMALQYVVQLPVYPNLIQATEEMLCRMNLVKKISELIESHS